MRKFSILFVFILFSVITVSAQKSELLVKNSDKGLYLEHKVQPKESFYALGRIYNIDPKVIAAFNSIDYNKGLQIDQKLRIPLTSENFKQEGGKGSPIYYKVGDSEGLMTVSKKHNNVLLTNLRWWNNLTSDQVKSDTKIIVGFIESSQMKAVTIAGKPGKDVQPALDESTKVAKNPVVKEKEKIETVIVNEEEKKEEPVEVVKKKEPPVVIEEKKTTTIDQGYFKNHFQQQITKSPATKDETVTAGIFKTTSGWQDAKYYLLIDKVSPGTIVKVINPTNNKAVYAKVLGEMSGIRQNAGLDIRLSNAAASALEITEDGKFIVKVNY